MAKKNFTVKYIPPKKTSEQHKYLCNTCLWKLHVGKMSDWIECQSRADVFYNYVKRGQFTPKREITVRFSLNPGLLNFYYSLPEGQRTAIIEESLRGFI